MFGKLFLTVAAILGAYLLIRFRMQRGREMATAPPGRPGGSLPRAPAARTIAYGLVTVLVAGSLLWLYLDWQEGRGVVTVQVINAATGDITRYQARRGAVDGRHFTTLDGRRVTLADVERMVLEAGR